MPTQDFSQKPEAGCRVPCYAVHFRLMFGGGCCVARWIWEVVAGLIFGGRGAGSFIWRGKLRAVLGRVRRGKEGGERKGAKERGES